MTVARTFKLTLQYDGTDYVGWQRQTNGVWAAVLRIPSTRSEEDVVLDLLRRDSVLVHPGYFFDFAHEAFLIVSLLPPLAMFREGIQRIMSRIHG